MFDKEAIKNDFSKAADSYAENAKLQLSIKKSALKLSKSYFPKKAVVLDLGCGPEAIDKGDNDWKIIGVDISYGMCKEASRKNSLIINSAAEKLPLADESVDCVFSSLLLQWIEKPELVILEILRVLKMSGTAIITTFVHGTLNELEEAFTTIDSNPHITPFIEPNQLLFKIAHIGGFTLKVIEKRYVESFHDIYSLMKSIKSIGAGNKLNSRRKGLMTPVQFKKLENSYKKEKGKYPISWNVLTVVIGKL